MGSFGGKFWWWEVLVGSFAGHSWGICFYGGGILPEKVLPVPETSPPTGPMVLFVRSLLRIEFPLEFPLKLVE